MKEKTTHYTPVATEVTTRVFFIECVMPIDCDPVSIIEHALDEMRSEGAAEIISSVTVTTDLEDTFKILEARRKEDESLKS